MATILVTDGEQRAALAITRSLGRRGHRVMVGSALRSTLAGASRFCAERLVLPDPLADARGYARAIENLIGRAVIEVVLPVTEPALLAVLAEPGVTTRAIVPWPDLATFRRASDKAWVGSAAEQVGLAVPRQTVVQAPDDVSDLSGFTGRSLVLKPHRSISGGRKLSVSYVQPGGDLRAAVERLPPEAFPLLVQERIVGPGVGLFLLRWDGRIRALSAHRRLREKPPSGGVSVLRESVGVDPVLQGAAERLFELLGWRGVAMLELKVDRGTGIPYVMEINGRFWGSLQLSIDSGVDFPGLLVDLALGAEPGPMQTGRAGVRSRWLLGDVDHLLLRLRRSQRELDLPPGEPGRARVIRDFVTAFLPTSRSEILRVSDPLPFARELWDWVQQVAQRSGRSSSR